MKKLGMVVGVLLVGLLTSASSCSKFAASLDDDYRYSEMIQKTIHFAGKTELSLDNSVGSITIEDGPQAVIELTATKKAKFQSDLTQVSIEIQEGPTSVTVRSVYLKDHGAKWSVDYVVKVPAGTELKIDQGVGRIRITNHEGSTSIDLGVGDVRLVNMRADEVSLDLGVGDADLIGMESKSVSASVGTGDLDVRLRPDASFTVHGDVGLGDVSIQGFPNMQVEREGFIAQSVRAVLGTGEGQLDLDVGVGDLDVRPLESQ